MKLLPIEFDEEELGAAAEANVLMNYEPNETEALDMIIPKYVTSLFYGALVEAVASENGARMQAMDSATSNAEDMISDLTLKYNRARQRSLPVRRQSVDKQMKLQVICNRIKRQQHKI